MTTVMHYTLEPSPGVDPNAPLIYRWEIRDPAGNLVGRYVGKAKGGDRRPTGHYKRNVDKLLAGKPYRLNNPEYRKVHRGLALAAREQYQISLAYLCNVGPGEDIDALEQLYIRNLNCLDPVTGLNANGARASFVDLSTSVAASGHTPSPASVASKASAVSGVDPNESFAAIRAYAEKHHSQVQPRLISGHRLNFYIGDVRVLRAKAMKSGKVSLKAALSGHERTWDQTEGMFVSMLTGEVAAYERHYAKK